MRRASTSRRRATLRRSASRARGAPACLRGGQRVGGGRALGGVGEWWRWVVRGERPAGGLMGASSQGSSRGGGRRGPAGGATREYRARGQELSTFFGWRVASGPRRPFFKGG